jgi:hypothetical protein
MAGNGFEWSRTYQDAIPGEFRGNAKAVPVRARVILRGRDFAHPNPLRFEELENTVTFEFFEHMRTNGMRPLLGHIGFRVVIEED